MPLNIKDKKAHQLARKLAAVTGESMTVAVRAAIEERLARETRRRQGKATAAELLEIGRRFAARVKKPPEDHGTLLYDEHGLPR